MILRSSSLLASLLAATVSVVCLWPNALLSLSGELLRHWLMWSAAALAALLLLRRPPAIAPLVNADLLAIGLFLACVVLSTTTALHPTQALLGSNERGLGALSELAWWVLALAAFRLTQERDAIALWRWIASITLLLSLWAVIDRVAAFNSPAIESTYRSSAALGNPLFLATLLATTLPLQFSSAVWPRRWLRGMALSLQCLGLLSTGGRGAVLAALLGLLLLAAYRTGYRRKKLLAAGLACLVLLAASAAHWRPASVAIRSQLYSASAQAIVARETLHSIDGQPDPIAVWRPLVGYGPESIEPALTRYRSAELNSHWHEHAGWDRWADRAHSRLLDRLLETGLLGLAAALWLIYRVGRRLWPLLSSAPSAPIAVGLLIWTTAGIIGVPSAAADLVAALMLGGGLALSANTGLVYRPRSIAGLKPILLGAAYALSLVASTAAIAWIHLQMAAKSLPTSAATKSAINLAMQRQPYSALPALLAVSQRLKEPRLADDNLAQLHSWTTHAIQAAPSVPRAWLLHGQVHQLYGNTDEATRAWIRGLSLINRRVQLSPDELRRLLQTAVTLTQIGQGLQTQGRLGDAFDAFDAARDALESQSAPNSAAWWATLAWLRARDGEIDPAIDAYRRVLRINPSDAASGRNLRRLEAAKEQVD